VLRYHYLIYKIQRQASRGKLSGVDAISYAGQLAEHLDSATTAGRMVAELFDNESPQIRHIALNAIRRAHRYDAIGLSAAVARRLLDSEPSVRRDAVVMARDGQLDGGELRTALRVVAGDVQLPQDAERSRQNPTDTTLAVQVQAREWLDELIARTAAAEVAALSEANSLGMVAGQAYNSDSVGQEAVELEAMRQEAAKRRAKG
jgi:hypothetical protein